MAKAKTPKATTTVSPPQFPTTLEQLRYWYAATVLEVMDGDTLKLFVDQGLDGQRKLKTRLAGINCPEMDTEEGIAAKFATVSWLQNTQAVMVRTVKDKTDAYGRYLSWIFHPGGECLNVWLWNNGHAVPSDGRKR